MTTARTTPTPEIGDSAITETYGVGGFSMAAAPAIVRFVGGTVPGALATTERMHQVTMTENPAMAGRVAGTGQVGAGLVRPPQACFEKDPGRARRGHPPLTHTPASRPSHRC